MFSSLYWFRGSKRKLEKARELQREREKGEGMFAAMVVSQPLQVAGHTRKVSALYRDPYPHKMTF